MKRFLTAFSAKENTAEQGSAVFSCLQLAELREQILLNNSVERHACVGNLRQTVDEAGDCRDQHRNVVRHKRNDFLELERAVYQRVVLEVNLTGLLKEAERAERTEVVAVVARMAELHMLFSGAP